MLEDPRSDDRQTAQLASSLRNQRTDRFLICIHGQTVLLFTRLHANMVERNLIDSIPERLPSRSDPTCRWRPISRTSEPRINCNSPCSGIEQEESHSARTITPRLFLSFSSLILFMYCYIFYFLLSHSSTSRRATVAFRISKTSRRLSI